MIRLETLGTDSHLVAVVPVAAVVGVFARPRAAHTEV